MHMGFAVTRGIRQGCPLSPLLFAVVSELILRRLKRSIPHSVRRSDADDLAMVINNGYSHLQTLASIFDEFARVSGLHLNTGKTVIVPLLPYLFSMFANGLHALRRSGLGLLYKRMQSTLDTSWDLLRASSPGLHRWKNILFEPQLGGERG